MRSFLTGLVIGVIGLVISFFSQDTDKIIYTLLIIGFIPIIISGFMTGAYVSGDRVRGNYTDSKDFSGRSGRSAKLFVFGLPCVLSAIVISFIV
ncbi:DUF5316 family protein [Desulfosporosinus youngiae]|uniref:Uncharacterized protein n=1 Tax=Desulfosporosinus youngiae DSM 17734 TaxID=768710 RepID=H5XV46_9FIRM|nr:DUF5316 family protein [Desulfosporosinus youngiae]EHQ89644.1 hypothetical protein DesyoDRAFT_2578 [Desulfosporosinus youngiae DSM 17734]